MLDRRKQFYLRFALLSGVGLLSLWEVLAVPWGLCAFFLALTGAMYSLLQTRKGAKALRGVSAALDLLMLSTLIRLTGGPDSPLVGTVFVWLLAVYVLYAKRYGSRLLYLSGGAFMAVFVSLAGFAGSWVPIGLHGLGIGIATLFGFMLLSERLQAQTDALTRVLHRREGVKRLERYMAKRRPFTLAFIDLKGFKHINDSYGHGVGDEVLYAVAGRLEGAVRQMDVIMRYGGDEFVVASDMVGLRPRLEAKLLEPVQVSIGRVEVKADIGEVRWQPGETLDTLLKRADTAMYQRKVLRRSHTRLSPGFTAPPSMPKAPAVSHD